MSMNINGLGNTYNDINTNSRQYRVNCTPCQGHDGYNLTLSRPFWTSACLPSTSKSNPTLFPTPPRKKGGLQRNPPISFRQFQSTSLNLHQPIPPSKAPAISATSESGTRTYLPSGTNHFPIGLSAPALTAPTANFFPATQKNIIAASIAPSGQI